VQEKLLMFENRLTKVFRHLSRQAHKNGISCYRIYDHDLPEFPFCIELYDKKLYVAEYKRHHNLSEAAHEEWIEQSLQVVSKVLNIDTKDIFLKLRQRKPGRLGQYQKSGDQQHEFIVEENGLQFWVNLSDYLDTGLFLDHRITRQMVRELSAGKKVLNLFAYTGSFSVYTAAGGAAEVTTVDLSKTYLNWAEKNMALNSFTDKKKYQFIQADVKAFLKKLPAEQFDIVVMDPPTFSNSKRMDDFLDIQKDHVELINDCLHAMKPGGILFFSTNYRKFILEATAIHGSAIKDITKATTPFDFAGKLFRKCFWINK
jgi:23S rRNA (cytosine1962-C5)-methyltransferase